VGSSPGLPSNLSRSEGILVGISWPIGNMEKRIVDGLAEIKETQTSHKRKKWRRSDHTSGGSTCGDTLVSTWVSCTHVGA